MGRDILHPYSPPYGNSEFWQLRHVVIQTLVLRCAIGGILRIVHNTHCDTTSDTKLQTSPKNSSSIWPSHRGPWPQELTPVLVAFTRYAVPGRWHTRWDPPSLPLVCHLWYTHPPPTPRFYLVFVISTSARRDLGPFVHRHPSNGQNDKQTFVKTLAFI